MNIGESGFMQRTSLAAIDGTVDANEIPGTMPAIIAIGGENTRDEYMGNYYAGKIYRALLSGGVSGVNVYAAMFNIPAEDSEELRYRAFKGAGRKLEMQYRPSTPIKPTTEHIINFYNTILKPRLFDKENKKLDTDVALNRIRQVKLFAHCHGATIIQEMAKVMASEMLTGGYTTAETKQIQKQLLVIQYAPLAPLEKSDFTTISFASSTDALMQGHSNLFANYIIRMGDNMPPAFFAEPHGNIFIANQLTWIALMEHELAEFSDVKKEKQNTFTPDGVIIYTAMYNALVRGAKHSLSGGALPDVKALTDGNGVNFDELRKNGDKFYSQIVADLRKIKNKDSR